MQSIQTDVIIVGKGIAGLCLAWLLQQNGIDAVLLGRSKPVKTLALAETLPPSALVLLEQLGFRALFERSALKKTLGYHSLWGTAGVVDINFFFHSPFQYGLKLDKQKLLRALEKQLARPAVAVDNGFEFHPVHKEIHFRSENGFAMVKGKVFVEATGRSRALLKAMNIPVWELDHQLAFSCHLPRIRPPQIKHDVFTELFDGGWGIVSGLDEETNVMTLFANKGTLLAGYMRDYTNWRGILTKTRLLKEFLVDSVGVKVTGAAANSSRAERIAGQGWLAVGDAAIAFDPLSSHGITNAVYCAWQAASAITQALKTGTSTPLLDYANTLEKIFEGYLETQQRLRQVNNLN